MSETGEPWCPEPEDEPYAGLADALAACPLRDENPCECPPAAAGGDEEEGENDGGNKDD